MFQNCETLKLNKKTLPMDFLLCIGSSVDVKLLKIIIGMRIFCLLTSFESTSARKLSYVHNKGFRMMSCS